jgi:tetratricopeptide repeat protein 21B
MPFDASMAEEFELAYLLLAKFYVDKGKFDLAQDLARR